MNILFVTANRIGDAVLSSGLLGHLIATHPEAGITVACGPLVAPLFRATPNISRIIPMSKQPAAGHWFRLWRETVTTAWDLVVDLRSSALAWLLPAKSRRVLHKSGAPEHRIALYARVLGLAQPAPPKIWIAEEHRQAAEGLIPNRSPVLALGPTANWGAKQWPADSFVEVARRLTAPGSDLTGSRVAIFGAAHERTAVQPIVDAIGAERTLDLVGETDLLTAYACLERCALYIGNDSGLMHLAAASGVPTLGLFGPSREVHYAPWGAHAAAVRTPASFEELVGAPGYDFRDQTSLMGSLSVDAVEAAAWDLWRRDAQGSR